MQPRVYLQNLSFDRLRMRTRRRSGKVALLLILVLGVTRSTAAQALLLEDFATMRNSGYAGVTLWDGGATPDQSSRVEFHDGDMRLRTDITRAGYQLWFFPLQSGPRYPYPSGYTQGWIKSGTWDRLINRMEFWIKCNDFVPTNPRQSMNIGTYVKPTNAGGDDQGSHYYHFLHPNLYANRWAKIMISWTPTHNRDFGLHNYPSNPSRTDLANFSYTTPVDYFDGLAPWYIAIASSATTPSPTNRFTCWVDDFYLLQKTGEPDAEVRSVTATYNGSAYELSWDGLMNSTLIYEIRYSTTSMKSNGFASGTSGGTRQAQNSAYPGLLWTSPPMPQAAGMYFAIKPATTSQFMEVYLPVYGQGPPPSCDANGDGVVNVADVQLAVNTALGTAPCTTDLDQNGRCDIVDVQRVVNAALGSACRIGP